ncbi:MAG: hypothetical protein HY707_14305 [Ignavibacteriae bacterium]|nr:hypothetical protein [Ignavibacteriota bacterium]
MVIKLILNGSHPKNIRLAGSLGSKEETTLFGSGASYSLIQPNLARALGHVEPLPEPMDSGTAKNGESLQSTEAVRFNFYLGEVSVCR